MQNYSYYFIPIIPYSQPIYTLPSHNSHTNVTMIPVSQPIDLHISIQNQSLLPPTSTPSRQQEPLILPSSPPSARFPHRSSETHRADPPQQAPNKTLVVDHNVYKYPKKNAQSNLINQIVSYISIPSKSSESILKIFKGRQQKAHLFYELMKQVKRQNKKYINRSYLKDLLAIEQSHIIHGILQKNKIEPLLTRQELQSALRRIVFEFLMQKSALTVLTSNKLDRFSMKEHLQRRREVVEYLQYHLKSKREEELVQG